jgi:signal peptidase I
MRKRKHAALHIAEWLVVAAIPIAMLWYAGHYYGEPFRVRSQPLVGDYAEGAIVWVDKTYYGLRAPFGKWWYPPLHPATAKPSKSYQRGPARHPIRHNDLLVYNHLHPDTVRPDLRLRTMNRVVALPGDTLRIYNGKLYINGKAPVPPPHVRIHFEAFLSDSAALYSLTARYDLREVRRTKGAWFEFAAHPIEALALAGDTAIDRFNRMVEHLPNPLLFPTGYEYQNADNFGPVHIPYRGLRAHPDSLSPFAERLWQLHETKGYCEPLFTPDSVPCFTFDYYFVMSDLRRIGHDSRYHGPIPEYLIIGRPTRVLYTPVPK